MGGGGGGKGGGSSTSSTVEVTAESTNTVDIVGLDDVDVDLTLNVPEPIETAHTLNVPEPIETAHTLDLRPVDIDLDTTSNSTSRLTIDPLETDSRLSVDLRPVVLDLCLTANVGKVPDVCIRQPYHHHIGITLFGMEMFGFTFSGEQQTVVEELGRQPKLALGGAGQDWPPRHERGAPPTRDAGGLRIRLGS
jgi:hypothetical protein